MCSGDSDGHQGDTASPQWGIRVIAFVVGQLRGRRPSRMVSRIWSGLPLGRSFDGQPYTVTERPCRVAGYIDQRSVPPGPMP